MLRSEESFSFSEHNSEICMELGQKTRPEFLIVRSFHSYFTMIELRTTMQECFKDLSIYSIADRVEETLVDSVKIGCQKST